MARPQKLNDAEIVSVIDSMRRAELPCTGVDIRRELHRRFGIRTGTDRLYKLLRSLDPTGHTSDASALTSDLGMIELAHQRDVAVHRAELAEFREQATQDRMASEIDNLRQRLRALGVDPFSADRHFGSRPFPV